MKAMKSNQPAEGFTLLEVLIAMAIFSVISLTSYTMLTTVINSDQAAQQHSQKLNQLQRAFMIMQRDFLQLARRSVRIEGENPQTQWLLAGQTGLDGEAESIGFVRSGWRNPGLLLPRSDMQALFYSLEDNKLMRHHYNFVDALVGEKKHTRALLSEVESLEFQFFYANKWQKQLPQGQIPQAISVKLALTGMGEVERKFLLPGDIELARLAR